MSTVLDFVIRTHTWQPHIFHFDNLWTHCVKNGSCVVYAKASRKQLREFFKLHIAHIYYHESWFVQSPRNPSQWLCTTMQHERKPNQSGFQISEILACGKKLYVLLLHAYSMTTESFVGVCTIVCGHGDYTLNRLRFMPERLKFGHQHLFSKFVNSLFPDDIIHIICAYVGSDMVYDYDALFNYCTRLIKPRRSKIEIVHVCLQIWLHLQVSY
jgi:hypothetical protein